MNIRAADLLVKTLVAHKVESVYCVPGESYLSVLDSLYSEPKIKTITCRHEGGAGFMALGVARLKNEPGVLFVSRGPGAMNAAIAVHSAQQDACPLVMFVGQAERDGLWRQGFQSVNYKSLYGDMAKWVVEVWDPSSLSEVVCAAFYLAQSGTPGPVVISLPEDMLDELCPNSAIYPRNIVNSAAQDNDVDEIRGHITDAKRPLIIAGGMLKSKKGKRILLEFAEYFSLPVAATVRHADVFPNEHPLFAGHLTYGLDSSIKAILSKSDLVLALGTRLGDVSSQKFQFPAAPKANTKLIHVWPDENIVNRYRQTDLGIAAHPIWVMRQIMAGQANRKPLTEWTNNIHKAAEALRFWIRSNGTDDGVVFGDVVATADELIPKEAIMCLDAGNFGGWIQRQFRFGPTRKLIGPSSGAMGYGIPAAIACSLEKPGKKVICFVGDGGFLMTGSELATASQFGATPIIIVADNSSYGTIRMHQELRYSGKPYATTLQNPDFTTMAKSYGAFSYQVQHIKDFAPALRAALEHDKLSVIVVKTSLEAITPTKTLAELRKYGSGSKS